MSLKKRIAIFISGRGSNMRSLIEACAKPSFPASVELIISNNPDASGLDIARKAGIATQVIDDYDFGNNRQAHERQINAALQTYHISTICLAGYMKILTPFLINQWSNKILNIHPSLLPAFPGLHTHKKALQKGVKIHGCTVHLVNEKMDDGPILGQAAVPVLSNDTEEILAQRVLAQEHILYPKALKHFLLGFDPDPSIDALING